MFKIQQNKEKLILVMTTNENDESFANVVKKFKNASEYKNTLKDFKVNVTTNGTTSEFSSEIQGENLEEAMQRLESAKIAIYAVLHQLEEKEKELLKKEETDACPLDELELLDKCEMIVVIIPNRHDND